MEGDQLSLQIQDTPGGIQVRTVTRVCGAAASNFEVLAPRSRVRCLSTSNVHFNVDIGGLSRVS